MKIRPIPHIIYTDEELLNIGKTIQEITKIRMLELGRSWTKDEIKLHNDYIFLNIDSDFLWQIIDTLVHELLHIKDKKLRHGKKFQDKVNNIIMSA